MSHKLTVTATCECNNSLCHKHDASSHINITLVFLVHVHNEGEPVLKESKPSMHMRPQLQSAHCFS